MAEKVRATVSHRQEIDGKEYGPGDSVSLDAPLARKIAGRGGIQIDEGAAQVAFAPKKEVAK